MDKGFLIVWCTCPDDHTANTISKHLVDQQLAACVTQLAGARSVYRWKGKIETAEEVVLMIKTRASAYKELEAAVEALHPYELPELIATRIEAGVPDYLGWVFESVK